jgi:glutathione S-transferase
MAATVLASSLKLYGVPLSQPFRSVAWTLLQKGCRFEIVVTVPFISDKKIGSGHESYVSKTKARSNRIPLLEDGSLAICESPAMLTYLCESQGWQDDLYGRPGTARKATIDSYMHWHHSGTRVLAMLVGPLISAGSKYTVQDRYRERAYKTLEHLEHSWLKMNPGEEFIVGGDGPSIADLLCYEEIAQVTMTGMIELDDEFPNIRAWVKRMQQLPYHEEAHMALKTLGNLTEPNDTPMRDRLRAATQAGLSAMQKAQEDFPFPKIPSKL